MQTVIISTTADDVHGAFVEAALEQIGWRCFRWVNSDLPSKQEISISIGGDGCSYITVGTNSVEFEIPIKPESIVFWNRRHAEKPVFADELHISDSAIAARELSSFRDNVIFLLNTARWVVNRTDCARRAENKALQLQFARAIGLHVPRTCISNSPDRIREFVQYFSANGGCLAKPFRGGMWKSGEDVYVSYSAIVTLADLPADFYTRSAPMIFQAYIEKAFEVRITAFGSTLVAVKLHSQNDSRTKIDWRTVSPDLLKVEWITIPGEIQVRCIDLMRQLGLVFGCFDFVVNKQGEWIFLEINQMGQFLWVEQANADVPILDMFVQLLTRQEQVSETAHFGIRLASLAEKVYARLRSERPARAPMQPIGFVYE